MRRIGFSTGAIARGDFFGALEILQHEPKLNSVELSALRVNEVKPLVEAISMMDLRRYAYISFHAPSSYRLDEELFIAEMLDQFLPEHWPIVLHPDTICDHSVWRRFGARIAIENVDRRKSTGRTARELSSIFELLPEARFCLDLGHARQCDTSMLEAFRIIELFANRLAQIHISEVNSASQHDPISYAGRLSFSSIARLIPNNIPVILEGRVASHEIASEIDSVLASLPFLQALGEAARELPPCGVRAAGTVELPRS